MSNNNKHRRSKRIGTAAQSRAVPDVERDYARLLDDVVDGSGSPIFVKDLEGRFITINAALERLLGISRHDLRGKTDYDIADREAADRWRAHDRRAMETRQAIQIEETALLQGQTRIFLAHKIPLIDANGRLYGVASISHDITNRKAMEARLRESEQRFRSVLDNAVDVIYRANLQTGRYDYISPSI